MLTILKKSKTLLTITIATFVIVLGLMGANWQLGRAETIPTIPTLPTVPTIPLVGTISPSTVNVDSPDTLFTMTGTDFIDTTYTKVYWISPNGEVFYEFPDTVNVSGTELTFTIPASYLHVVGIANIWVINHPDEIEKMEISGPYHVTIANLIYLPLILK